jgi:aminoglycoside phosphotransferase (APT) family kinase protein
VIFDPPIEAPLLDEALVGELVASQFPQWAGLPIRRVARDGWDNRSFRLGAQMVVRLPSAAAYASQVEKEQRWLPRLAPSLSCPVPLPLAHGGPGSGYPWAWSIHRWIEGENADAVSVARSVAFATDLARFLAELQRIDTTGGPAPGDHNFHRGGSLATYDAEVREAVGRLGARIDAVATIRVWESALRTAWDRAPVWVHGDVSLGNLLAIDGRLAGVLDFGGLCVGDPACDLTAAWTVFRGDARRRFLEELGLDAATSLRARAWGLWKGLIVAADLAPTNAVEWDQPLNVLAEFV